MIDVSYVADSPPDAPALAQAAFQEWQSGNQQGAIDRLRPRAEAEEPWAIALLVHLYMQQGMQGFPLAVPFAKRAQMLGMPWAAINLFNNIIANIVNAPHLIDIAMDLAGSGPLFAPGIDPAGQGWNLLSQGRADLAVRLLSMRGPYPFAPAGWQDVVDDAHAQTRKLAAIAVEAETASHRVDEAVRLALDEVSAQQGSVETAARQANLLVSDVNSGALGKLFAADATRHEKESRSAWRAGIGVLVAAAAVAILPLLLHYLGSGQEFDENGLLVAHGASTVALGAVAGVLLSRSRGRDRAARRANDLSTAMGTMIAYSNQIADAGEKQKFMLTMGQLVLQAHLQQESASSEESTVGLASLVAALRAPT